MAEPSNRELILERALTLFNEQGIEGVGVRELARDLGLSPGNVSYHFKRKDDLVVALAQQLNELNNRTYDLEHPAGDVAEWMERYAQLFRNQWAYRALALALPSLMMSSEPLRQHYDAVQEQRRGNHAQVLRSLERAGQLKRVSAKTRATLVGSIALIGRFWLADHMVSYPHEPLERVIRHVQSLLANVLLPHATPAGQRALAPFCGRALSLDRRRASSCADAHPPD